MMQLWILSLCVLGLSAQDNNKGDASQNVIIDTINTNTSHLANASNAVPELLNGTIVKDSNESVIESRTGIALEANQTASGLYTNESTINDADYMQSQSNKTDDSKPGNETFLAKVEQVMRRLFKRDIVGSLVRRNTNERMEENAKITVPMFFQGEYYQLRKRKEEIEENKNQWRDAENMTKYEDLIQNTWEKLVNWSQDHLKFEDKIIRINRLKQHDHIQRSKDMDSDDSMDSEDKLRSIDSDEDSDKSMKPEFATVKNLAEVRDKYAIQGKIAELEKLIADHPKTEDNEKNRLLLSEYKHELKLIEVKYDRIRAMKLNRKLVEEVWEDKQMVKKRKEGEKDSDDTD